MAKLLAFATVFLMAFATAVSAQGVCPDFINVTHPFIISEIINGVYQDDAYYAVSCTTPVDQSGGNGDTKGCTTAPSFITRYVNGKDSNHFDTENGCSYNAPTKVSATATALGCNYHFTNSEGYNLYVNVSCGSYSFVMGSEVDITNNGMRIEFTAIALGVCGNNTLTTVTYPTPPTTSAVSGAPTTTSKIEPITSSQSSTSGATSLTSSTAMTAVSTSANKTTVPPTSTTVTSTLPTTTTAPTGTNVTFASHTSDASLLLQYILGYLGTDVPPRVAAVNSITATCNQTVNVDGNYTCVATFANYTQATEVVEGANEGKIAIVASARIDNPATTAAPAKKDDDKVGLIVGVIVGGVAALAIIVVAAVFFCRRSSSDQEGMSLNKNLM